MVKNYIARSFHCFVGCKIPASIAYHLESRIQYRVQIQGRDSQHSMRSMPNRIVFGSYSIPLLLVSRRIRRSWRLTAYAKCNNYFSTARRLTPSNSRYLVGQKNVTVASQEQQVSSLFCTFVQRSYNGMMANSAD